MSMTIIKTTYQHSLVCDLCGNIINADVKLPKEYGNTSGEGETCPCCGIGSLHFENLPIYEYRDDDD